MKKELVAEGHLSFISDEIDNYYTQGSKNQKLKDLANMLNKLKEAYYENPRYNKLTLKVHFFRHNKWSI